METPIMSFFKISQRRKPVHFSKQQNERFAFIGDSIILTFIA